MASAAAVGADYARSPIENDIGEDGDRPGEITSGVYSKDEGLPDMNGDTVDSDEELPSNPVRAQKSGRRVNGDMGEDEEEKGGLDLFGDEEEGAEAPEKLA